MAMDKFQWEGTLATVLMILCQLNLVSARPHVLCKENQVMRQIHFGLTVCCNTVRCDPDTKPVFCTTPDGNDKCTPCDNGTVNPFTFDTKTSHISNCKTPDELCKTESPETHITNMDECRKTGIAEIECDRTRNYTGTDVYYCRRATVTCLDAGIELTLHDTCEPCKWGFNKVNPGPEICVKDENPIKEDERTDEEDYSSTSILPATHLKQENPTEVSTKDSDMSPLLIVIYVVFYLSLIMTVLGCFVAYYFKKEETIKKKVAAMLSGMRVIREFFFRDSTNDSNSHQSEGSGSILPGTGHRASSGSADGRKQLSNVGSASKNPPTVQQVIGNGIQEEDISIVHNIDDDELDLRIGGTQACASLPSVKKSDTGASSLSLLSSRPIAKVPPITGQARRKTTSFTRNSKLPSEVGEDVEDYSFDAESQTYRKQFKDEGVHPEEEDSILDIPDDRRSEEELFLKNKRQK